MRVLITGATGFLGRALVLRLRRDGHRVVAWARNEDLARQLLAGEADVVSREAGLRAAVASCDAVVNLAGENLFAGRWTKRRRAALIASRVQTTELLVAAIESAGKRPTVMISGSAVGYYGDTRDRLVDETSDAGQDFLARLCKDWEAAARRAEPLGVRVVLLRTGVVLGRDGGALAKMLPPFRVGLGGRIGSGRQYLPWIHIDDLVEIIATALTDVRYTGPINGTAPTPVTSAEFARALGRALHRPALCPVPGILLRLGLGQVATVLLGGQRTDARRLRELGFRCSQPTLEAALWDLLGNPPVTFALAHAEGERGVQSPYLASRRAQYELRATMRLCAPIEEVFAFFCQPQNLALITPPSMHFVSDHPSVPLGRGVVIDSRLRVGGLPMRWRTLIEDWRVNQSFVDVQERGPYQCWWHQHRFRRDGDHTVMEDRVLYAPPLRVLGRIANALLVRSQLRAIFGYRSQAMRLRFGVAVTDAMPVERDR